MNKIGSESSVNLLFMVFPSVSEEQEFVFSFPKRITTSETGNLKLKKRVLKMTGPNKKEGKNMYSILTPHLFAFQALIECCCRLISWPDLHLWEKRPPMATRRACCCKTIKKERLQGSNSKGRHLKMTFSNSNQPRELEHIKDDCGSALQLSTANFYIRFLSQQEWIIIRQSKRSWRSRRDQSSCPAQWYRDILQTHRKFKLSRESPMRKDHRKNHNYYNQTFNTSTTWFWLQFSIIMYLIEPNKHRKFHTSQFVTTKGNEE